MSRCSSTTVIYFVCAWCKSSMGVARIPWSGVETETTHGICDPCSRRLRAQRKPSCKGTRALPDLESE